ncbi:hypothetical protein Tco_0488920 [Tanacetum coccineum]
MVTESLDHEILAKESSQPQSLYEAAATLIEFELKKILTDKMDKNKDEDPFTGSDRGLKKRKTSKDAESTKGPKAKESQSGSSKGDKSQSKSSRKSVESEEPEFEVADSDMPQDQKENPSNDDEEPKGKLEYDFEECYKALSKKLDWENPEGDDYPFDLTKPLPLVMSRNRQKTKAAQYDLPGIKDTVPNIWSPVKVAYDKHALWGISHWRNQLKRADNNLYTFKEGDFPRLRINDIKDMLLLVKRVEDLQLIVESYEKKINITKPETTKPDIRKRDPYTPYQDPQGFIYVDTLGRNRLMRSDELYMFSDRTLTGL